MPNQFVIVDRRGGIRGYYDSDELGLDEIFHRSRHVVQTASLWQVRQPLYRHASGRWRHYERHLADLRQALHGSSLPADGHDPA